MKRGKTDVLYDKKEPLRVKVKLYKSVAMMYGSLDIKNVSIRNKNLKVDLMCDLIE